MKIVQVKWLDSSRPSGGWQNQQQYKDFKKDDLECLSTGILLFKNKKRIILASSMTESQVGEMISIPWAIIQEMKVIGKVDFKGWKEKYFK